MNAPKQMGCHCDLDPDAAPDGCVLDEGRAQDCRVAMHLEADGKGRDDCEFWRPVVVMTSVPASEIASLRAANAALRSALGDMLSVFAKPHNETLHEVIAARAALAQKDEA